MTQLLNDFLSGSAAWGVLLTLAAFALGTLINKVTGKAIFNPLLLGSIFVIIFLSVCSIPYADYKVSAAPVNYLLLPATVALAIPLYEKLDLLKANAAAIIAGISVGTLVSLGSALALALALAATAPAVTPAKNGAADGAAHSPATHGGSRPHTGSQHDSIAPDGACARQDHIVAVWCWRRIRHVLCRLCGARHHQLPAGWRLYVHHHHPPADPQVSGG